jgi:hypothetical protein
LLLNHGAFGNNSLARFAAFAETSKPPGPIVSESFLLAQAGSHLETSAPLIQSFINLTEQLPPRQLVGRFVGTQGLNRPAT